MVTPIDIVKEYFPEATDDEADGLLWERTGFPCFWSSEDGSTPEECIRKQLAEFKEALRLGVRLCDMCNRPALAGRMSCLNCWAAISLPQWEWRGWRD